MSKNWLLKKILERKKQKLTIFDRMLLGILAMGLVMIIGLIIYFLWFIFTNRSVINFLPAQKTVAFFELEDSTLPPKLSQQTLFDLTGVSALLDKTFGLNIKDVQDHLTQGRLGFALIKEKEDGGNLVLFFRTRSKSDTLKYFQSLGLQNEKFITVGEKKDIIYMYPQSHSFAFSFIGPYFFLSQNIESLKDIQSVYQKKETSLYEDIEYQKSLANLPRTAWGQGYLNVKLLSFPDNNPLNLLADPLKTIINHFALAIRKQQNGFHFNTLLSINPSLLSLNKGYTDSTRFAYSLADYIGSKNLAVYIGGANLSDEWQNTLETISNLNPAYGIIMEGILRAQVSKIFGDKVDLRNDIYPLFDNEYAVAFESIPHVSSVNNSETFTLGIKLILKNDDRNFANTKLEKLLEGFKMLAAQFAPKLKVFTLPDGTESKELIADATRLQENKETYKDYEIDCLVVEETSYGFCYTATDQLIVISNNADSIKETIDLSVSPKFVLSQSQSFRKALSNLSAISDEITFVSLDNFRSLLKDTKFGPTADNLFSSFDAVTWIKHYFNDGVSTEGYLLLK